MKFVQLVVQEKSGGNHNGKTPDYRAFLYYTFDEAPGSEFELRGYGQTGAAAAADAWDRYITLGEENE